MNEQNSIKINVQRGVKVHVEEVDQLEGDRQVVAEAPAGLKIALRQTGGSVSNGLNKITMCG